MQSFYSSMDLYVLISLVLSTSSQVMLSLHTQKPYCTLEKKEEIYLFLSYNINAIYIAMLNFPLAIYLQIVINRIGCLLNVFDFHFQLVSLVMVI